jgi:hypothetical protein
LPTTPLNVTCGGEVTTMVALVLAKVSYMVGGRRWYVFYLQWFSSSVHFCAFYFIGESGKGGEYLVHCLFVKDFHDLFPCTTLTVSRSDLYAMLLNRIRKRIQELLLWKGRWVFSTWWEASIWCLFSSGILTFVLLWNVANVDMV